MNKQKIICAGCKQAIYNTFLRALGQSWHLEHFKCVKCQKIISTQTFFEKNGQAYCKNDFLKSFCHKCSKCHDYITEEVVNALGKFWHVQCFTCTTCNTPIKPPYFFQRDGKPYCNDDYAKHFTPLCTGCGEHIFEEYLEIRGRKFHTNCFLCKNCEMPIKKKFLTVGREQICTDCKKAQEDKKKPCRKKCCIK
ncbi:hypothetical protein WA026_017298 [Henosepilachna vigintioctopunctata]|uniref:LIM zinc-binding domain-containing protein n=1 Tax=Henosepilachna vigintioctopunctata TaxID=420089 RepID=A0AAW1UP88_9CUCU